MSTSTCAPYFTEAQPTDRDAATLTVTVGGEEPALRLVKPPLRELGQSLTRVGGSGRDLLLTRTPIVP